MTWLTFIMASLAAYRLGRLTAQEDGPGDVAARIRGALGQRTWIGRGAHCVACCTFWFAGIAALALVLTNRVAWGDFWLLWLGTAGGGLVIYQVAR